MRDSARIGSGGGGAGGVVVGSIGQAGTQESRWLPAGEKVVSTSLREALGLNPRNHLGCASCANHLLSLIQER